MKKIIRILLILTISLPLTACAQKVKEYKLKVLESLPHDKSAYTQGLFFYNNELYESCGQYGSSSFRKVDLKTGNVLRRLNFDQRYFVEGSCVLNDLLYILTWQEHKCFVYDAKTLKYLGELYNIREGWGLTTDGKQLIMTDGTANIYFLDPQTFAVKDTKTIMLNGKPVTFLNELEYINGEIWANVYTQDYILTIDPSSGKVTGKIDCTGLLPRNLRSPNTDVLNGIAHNPATGEIYLTGKYWPRMYKIEKIEK